MAGSLSIVDSCWELIDPNPNIFQLFDQFNKDFFWGRLGSVYVLWSPRMTLCAGLCKFHGSNRECSIHLSKPLLSLRPRKDLVETLLHEMIHAYLFVVDNNRERESHGPKFHEHMNRINKLTGAKITVYHTFHDEVDHFKTHWWRCDGPCQRRPPYFGLVKRSMNRAPGPNDFWHKDHQSSCGGKFTKIKEPTPKKGTKRKQETKTSPESDENKHKITDYFIPPASPQPTPATSTSPPMASETATVDPFLGRGFVLGSIGNSATSVSKIPVPSTSGSSGVALGGSRRLPPGRGEHPLLEKWKQNYKDLGDLRSSSSSSAKTSTLAATTTVPKPPPENRFRSTTLASNSLLINREKMKQSQDLPTSSSSSAKTSTLAATTTVPKPPPEKRYQPTTFTSSYLLANYSKMKLSQDLPSSSSSSAKTSTLAATTTVPNPPPEKRFQLTALTSRSLLKNREKMNQSQDSIEVIDLD